MSSAQVAPELRARLRRSPRLPVYRAPVLRFARFAIGRLPAPPFAGVTVEQYPEVGQGLQVYRPDTRRSDAALLWIHGGGLVMGAVAQDHRQCAGTALELGIPVVAVEYRKAPEHPFPAPLDDCQAAWEWLQGQAAALGVDPARVAVGGQSAGGGLAASLIQRLQDESGGPRLAAQWLHAPMLDDRTAARRDLDSPPHPVWSNRMNRFGWRSYLGADPGSAAAWPRYAVPARRDDLAGLPPAWVGVGEVDLFLAEARAYAQRLSAAGVSTTFHTVPGAPHGFETWASETTISIEYLAAARAWLRQTLRDGPATGT
ncbi:alpha/beta hydrolase [Parafrankia sp. FMc2]|uniref:alpha/beta hydrolase n=1 Tax=Parafrankia sp. FMc2 TaxID=3233196 RepID=UPI0034D785F7